MTTWDTSAMDDGLPIAYEVLDSGVPVRASDGSEVGRVAHVIADEREDVFHGLLVDTDAGVRFVAAEFVASLHEYAVDLSLDAAAAAQLPPPEHGSVTFHPDVTAGRWGALAERFSHRSWRRDR